MLSKDLLDIICCPVCKGDLRYEHDKDLLVCDAIPTNPNTVGVFKDRVKRGHQTTCRVLPDIFPYHHSLHGQSSQ